MLRVFTNNHDFALALNDLALFADGLDGRSDFHWKYLLVSGARFLLGAPSDSALCQIIGRHLDCNVVTGDDSDIVRSQLAGDMCKDHMAV